MRRIEGGVVEWDAGGGLGGATLRLLESGRFRSDSGFVCDHPDPPFNRLFVFTAGMTDIRTRRARLLLEPGAIHLLPAGMDFHTAYRPGCELVFVHFELLDPDGCEVFGGLQAPLALAEPALAATLAGLWRADGRDAGAWRWQAAVAHAVLALAAPLLAKPAAAPPPALRQALEFAGREANARLGVGDLARRCSLSRHALSAAARRHLGIPLKEHLQRHLLRRAQALLRREGQSVQHIASDLGFHDPAYFHRWFRRRCGTTPSSWRRQAGP